MRWVGHVERMGEGRSIYWVLLGPMREWDYLEDPDTNGKLILNWILIIRWSTDMSLDWPTSWCCMTESIVPLERAVCLCAELQVSYCYRGWKEACQAPRAISTTSRRERSPSFLFLPRQGVEENSRHSDRNSRGTWTIVYQCQKLGDPV
jgi:hypothetical protein